MGCYNSRIRHSSMNNGENMIIDNIPRSKSSFMRWTKVNNVQPDNLENNEIQGGLPQARYGHSVDKIGEEGDLILYGGFNGAYLSDVWIFETNNGVWRQLRFEVEEQNEVDEWDVEPTGPGERAFHASWVLNSELYIFGGFNGVINLNDLWVLNITNMRWTKIRRSVPWPTSRFEHRAVVIDPRNFERLNVDRNGGIINIENGEGSPLVYMFGGCNNVVWFHDMWVFNVATQTWKCVDISGKKPHGRCAHAMVAVDRQIYLFGGFNGSEKKRLKDAWMFDAVRRTWQVLPPMTQPLGSTIPTLIPSGGWSLMRRAAHTANYVSALHSIFLFGGFSGGFRSNTTYRFDLVKRTWDKPVIIGSHVTEGLPSGRSYHASTVIDNRIYILGGFDGTSKLNDVYYLERVIPSLSDLCIETIYNTKSKKIEPKKGTSRIEEITVENNGDIELEILPEEVRARIYPLIRSS